MSDRDTAAQSGTCPICHTPFGQPADDRRMVDRLLGYFEERGMTLTAGEIREALRECGGPAPSEATHRPKMPEVARKYDGEHGLVVEFEDEKP